MILAFAMTVLVALPCVAAKPTAASELDKVRARMASAGAVEAVFTINGGEGPVQGNAVISGNSFRLTTPQVEVWFDGKTQWTLLNSTDEVSISEPDADEIMSANPFAILTAHSNYYTARRLSDSGGRTRVELKPRDKSSIISSFIIMIDPATNWPAALVLKLSDNRKIDVVIDRIGVTQAKSKSFFTYNPSQHPAAEIIDLR